MSTTANTTHEPHHFYYYSALGMARSLAGFPIEHPLDNLKTRAQANSTMRFWSVFQEAIKSRGIPGLYHGGLPNTARELIKHSYRWPLMDGLHRFYESLLVKDIPEREAFCKVLTGLSLAGVETFVATPFERLKVWRITSGGTDYRHFHQSANGISTLWSSLYRGLHAIFIKQSLTATAFMTSNHYYKEYAAKSDLQKTHPFITHLLVWGSIGATMTAVALPLDNIKTHLQKHQTTEIPKITLLAKKLFQQHGLKGFYAGLPFRLIQYSVDAALSGYIWDKIMLKKT